MELGIVGLPLSGKSTVFGALTHRQVNVSHFGSGKCDVQAAVVDVYDARVNTLSEMFLPRKTTRARIQFNDISGVTSSRAERRGIDQQILTAAGKCDALVQVVRAFESERVPHPLGSVDPRRDLQALRLEFIISDLAVAERRIERIQGQIKKARPSERAALEHELALMQRIAAALEKEILIVDLDLDGEDEILIRGFQFLTAAPSMVLLNCDENPDRMVDLSWAVQHKRTSALTLQGSLEMEIAQLPEEEMAQFLEGYGLPEPGLHLFVRECYDLMGLMSFFTVGEDEVRAWTVRRGATALEAAGVIHTDLARGFIRTEVLSYQDMIAYGSLSEARKQGKLRLEGRDYVVQDGDILNIRFNI